MASFCALPLPTDDAPLTRRLSQVIQTFESHFGVPPTGVVRAPGRVNLIGEHVDYEGYGVLPMAIEQSVYVAFNTAQPSGNAAVGTFFLCVQNAQPRFQAVALSPQEGNIQECMRTLAHQGASWAKYVLCGVQGVREASPDRFARSDRTELQLLVDGDVPAGCGLSSSSALVVAAALATAAALQRSGQELPTRLELAELCRRAELHVGTMGGGMDQAVACLAQQGVALYLEFSSGSATSQFVQVPSAAHRVTFVVANSLVVAEKAVDADTHFNKRVIECALAAKLIAKKAGLDAWRTITRLVDVQVALSGTQQCVQFDALQELASAPCPLMEYSISELEEEFGEQIVDLFVGSELETTTKAVVASASTFKLQQRALHVWGEAERVELFRAICASLTSEKETMVSYQETVQAPNFRARLESLGKVMTASHSSCRTLCECSCPELDALVDAALAAGALGARLTGAGWGGCIVALVYKDSVSDFINEVQSIYYSGRRGTPADESTTIFETAPARGADIFNVKSG
uniref:Galactokinase n=1 Tax=Peronospora matthiolae TaxID=2874970 RepID=A0AAV1T6G2_9STRA